jgi:hypothetical protein
VVAERATNHKEEVMLNPRLTTCRRLPALVGLSLIAALAAVSEAAAKPLPLDGGMEPVAPAPVTHPSASSFDWSDVRLAVVVGLAGLIALAVIVAIGRSRKSLPAR